MKTRTRHVVRLAGAASALALLATGCGAAATPTARDDAASESGGECEEVRPAFYEGISADYPPRSAEEVLEDAEAVVDATLVAVHPGYRAKGPGPMPDTMHWLLAEFEVDAALKGGASELIHDRTTYVAVFGGASVNADARSTRDPEEIEAVMPVGTRAVLYLGRAKHQPADGEVAALPPGVPIAGVGYQGAYVDSCGRVAGIDSVWPEYKTIEDLAAAIARAQA